MLKYVILFVFIHGTDATCCCSENAITFPRIELTGEQRQTLRNLAQFLERIPCDRRTDFIYNMTQPPIQLTNRQIVGLVGRYSGSFQLPSDVQECEEPGSGQQQPPIIKRRRRTTGTTVCGATVEVNQKLYMAYNKRGELVYIAQPSPGNGIQQSQYFYESICLDAGCTGATCSCSTILIPSSTCIVNVIQGNSNTFTEQTVMTRLCQAFV